MCKKYLIIAKIAVKFNCNSLQVFLYRKLSTQYIFFKKKLFFSFKKEFGGKNAENTLKKSLKELGKALQNQLRRWKWGKINRPSWKLSSDGCFLAIFRGIILQDAVLGAFWGETLEGDCAVLVSLCGGFIYSMKGVTYFWAFLWREGDSMLVLLRQASAILSLHERHSPRRSLFFAPFRVRH